MRRRDFIKGIASSAATAWPLAAQAQQQPMPVIGFLHIGTADAYTNRALTAFRTGLKETGYVEGQNVTIEYRFAENKGDRLPALAADLVNRRVNLILELSGGAITSHGPANCGRCPNESRELISRQHGNICHERSRATC
jgi:putative tryptophan/tyrosine transport system substrate-binding protein